MKLSIKEVKEKVQQLYKGYGSLKYYDYYVMGLPKLKSKEAVFEAISLGIKNIMCKDKIMNEIQKFNYDTMQFEKI